MEHHHTKWSVIVRFNPFMCDAAILILGKGE